MTCCMKGNFTVQDLRWSMLKRDLNLLGLLDADKNSRFNLPLEEQLSLSGEDNLIVLGEK